MTDIYTQAIREAYASSSEPVLITLELSHPAWSEPVRVVYDHMDLVAPLTPGGPAATFVSCSFGCKLPKQGKDLPALEIWVDNVSQEIGEEMKAATGVRAPVSVTYREFLTDMLDQGPQYTLSGLTLKKVKVMFSRVSGTCGFLDFINRRCPSMRFTADDFPGLVR
ncbi:MAG: DUF1833 domain-containing protein [Pseudomonadales bacterium]|nr:DUF1833 domain-containing protein [Pseudomonadales bacterium]